MLIKKMARLIDSNNWATRIPVHSPCIKAGDEITFQHFDLRIWLDCPDPGQSRWLFSITIQDDTAHVRYGLRQTTDRCARTDRFLWQMTTKEREWISRNDLVWSMANFNRFGHTFRRMIHFVTTEIAHQTKCAKTDSQLLKQLLWQESTINGLHQVTSASDFDSV